MEPTHPPRFLLEPLPHGATLPWTSYDEDNFSLLIDPAHVVRTAYDSTFNPYTPAAEAQKNACVVLNSFGTRVAWTILEAANALNLRYSLADGDSGTITLTIDPIDGGPNRVVKVPVTSAQAWIYFEGGDEYDVDAPGRFPAKRFADARVLLDVPVAPGDTLSFSREAGDVLIWIDVVELETTAPYTPADPSAYYDATAAPWNAVGDGVNNDYHALAACLADAARDGKIVYLPPGRYNLFWQLTLPAETGLQGAGMWHTEIFFSRAGSQSDGGIRGDGDNLVLRDLFLTGSQNTRDGGYKGIKGHWGTGSRIESVWVENTETGMWISDFQPPFGITDGLIVRHCRFRNTFADGVNLEGGTRNAIVENCHFRSTGDDALASWAAGFNNNKGMTRHQRFRYNTIECGYRAGGIGIFGGAEHKIHHNVVRDQFVGAGIRFNTVFLFINGTQVGYPFDAEAPPIQVYENTLVRTGSRGLFGDELGAIDLVTQSADVANIAFSNLTIEQSQFNGIRFKAETATTTPAPRFADLSFSNITMTGVPIGTRALAGSLGTVVFDAVEVEPSAIEFELVRTFTVEAGPINAPPGVSLEMLETVALPVDHGLLLTATVSDDGRPDGGTLASLWTVVEQPAGSEVTFDNPASPTTGARFDLPGKYRLRLEATDGARLTGREVTVFHGLPWSETQLLDGRDIGAVGSLGSSLEEGGTLTLTGAGADIWDEADAFHFLAAPFQGDGAATVRLLRQDNTHPWAKAGLMIRDTLDPGSPHVLVATTPGNGLAFQFRSQPGGASLHASAGSYSLPIWLRLERSGSTVSAATSTNGVDWTPAGTATVAMTGTDYIGLAVSSHDPATAGEAVFSDFSSTLLSRAPMIDLSATADIVEGRTATLNGTLADDGRPSPPAALSARWESLTGPALLDFATAGASSSLVTAPAEGVYRIRLLADDGGATSFAERDIAFFDTYAGSLPFALWQLERFGATATPGALPLADPDQNGVTNLMEFAIGRPALDDAPIAPHLPRLALRHEGTARHIEFSFHRRTGDGLGDDIAGFQIDGLHYTVETSHDLAAGNWQPAGSLFTLVGDPLDLGDGIALVTLRTTDSRAPRFFRLQVQFATEETVGP
jgi:hypothetical protein